MLNSAIVAFWLTVPVQDAPKPITPSWLSFERVSSISKMDAVASIETRQAVKVVAPSIWDVAR